MEKITATVTLFGIDYKNGRKCCDKAIKEAVNDYIATHNGSSIIYGQINPSDYDVITNISNISHKIDINTFEFGEDGVKCNVEILDTPNGQVVQEMLKYGIKPNFGMRMLGNLVYAKDENGNETKEIAAIESPNIISIDII